jgi:hypothetical protein
MSNRISYRHNPLWDYRAHQSRSMAFKTATGDELDDTKRRALRADFRPLPRQHARH